MNMTTYTKVIQWNGIDFSVHGEWFDDLRQLIKYCPYGQPGDRLWVRETVARGGSGMMWTVRNGGYLVYKADYPDGCMPTNVDKWTPSIHMPRWASRINLEIVSVRIERLQDISEEDAIAEGLKVFPSGYVFPGTSYDKSGLCHTAAEVAYSMGWESINGPGSWDLNPWVWVVEFRRVI